MGGHCGHRSSASIRTSVRRSGFSDDPRERAALAYADAITLSDRDVDDAQFAALHAHFDEEAIIELTAVIAWENASSKFNRALRIESQRLWKRAAR